MVCSCYSRKITSRKMSSFKLHTDGGARGNPGPAAAGIVLETADGSAVKRFGQFLGHATNNEAEYQALILGLETAALENAGELECFLDSLLVVSQLKGAYKVKDARMKIFWTKAKELEKNFTRVSYTHVPRDKNSHADELVNEVLDAKAQEV